MIADTCEAHRGSAAHPRESSPGPSVGSDCAAHWRPADAHLASDPMTDIARALPSRCGANVRRSRAERTGAFRAIAATSATARSKTADQYAGSTDAEYRCAAARQFDGAARSLRAPARCGFGVRFGLPGRLGWSASP